MKLLGNLGGLLGSLMLIGAGLHFLIVDNTLPIQLMKHYFIVDKNDRDDEMIQSKQKSLRKVQDFNGKEQTGSKTYKDDSVMELKRLE